MEKLSFVLGWKNLVAWSEEMDKEENRQTTRPKDGQK